MYSFPINSTSANAKVNQKGEFNMKARAEYEIRILPSDPNSYVTLDSDPIRKCEANIVYKIPENTFRGINCKLRIRKKAKDFARKINGINTFAVILKKDETYQLLYVGKIYMHSNNKPILYLSRCVGSNISKHHFTRVRSYIYLYYAYILHLQQKQVLSLPL